MNAPESMQWSDYNQDYLVAKFEQLKKQFVNQMGDSASSEAIYGNESEGFTPAIEYLCNAFRLTPFERDLLLLCAGAEMDHELAELCRTYHGETSQCWPTIEMAFNILTGKHWSAITPDAALRLHQLIYLDESNRLLSARLRIDERVLHFLAGINYLEPRLRGLLKWLQVPQLMAPTQSIITESIQSFMQQNTGSPQTILLTGEDSLGKKDIAALVAHRCGMELYELKVDDLPDSISEKEAFARLWSREMVLLSAALYIDCEYHSKTEVVLNIIDRIGGTCFVAASDGIFGLRHSQRYIVSKPDAKDQCFLWQTSLGEKANRINGAMDAVASQFLFSANQIFASANKLSQQLETTSDVDRCFWTHCREIEQTRLGNLGQFIQSKAHWDDLILPEQEKNVLQQIAMHVRQRLKVYHDWGFADKGQSGLGISALFSGESGTGKTMAAEVLANELNLDLYRIDLSTVVSKYIGETEKNLSRVFSAAEHNGVILLFDEADALFGKRSDVKDSHDRYANLEVSYLLQRMEAFQGLAILTSNFKNSIDKAFMRRIRFIVQFPFPDQFKRQQIWEKVFPDNTPTNALDFNKLGRLNMAGGNIRNIAINAAFLAADGDEPVNMAHLVQAAHHEAAKREKTLSDVEIRGWIQ